MPRPHDGSLEMCRRCGCKGDGQCNRVVDRNDQSILPLRDTGFRIGMPMFVMRRYYEAPKRD